MTEGEIAPAEGALYVMAKTEPTMGEFLQHVLTVCVACARPLDGHSTKELDDCHRETWALLVGGEPPFIPSDFSRLLE